MATTFRGPISQELSGKKSTVANSPLDLSITSGYRTEPPNGYHPVQSRIQIIITKGGQANPQPTGKSIILHYDPKEFTESASNSFQEALATGTMVPRWIFEKGSGRTWTMTVLLNDMMDNGRRSPDGSTCEDCLSFLRTCMRTDGASSVRNTDGDKAKTPPALLVLFQSKAFLAYLKDMNIRYSMIHPTKRYTLRAEVELTFIEVKPSAI